MSALLIGLALAALPTNDELLSKRGTLFETAHHNLKFELFVPSNWQSPSATAKRYPVIVFLHGRGESGGFEINNAQSLPLQLLTNRSFAASFPFITVVPQCPRQCAMANHWLSTTLQSVTALVRDWVLHQPDAGNGGLGGERSKVYLAGQSMGGHGAWIYAAQQPRLFAAIVVVCGYMHGQREAKTIAERLRHDKVAVAIYHSADDVVIPVMAADQAAEALKATGGYRLLPDSQATEQHDKGLDLLFVRYDHAPGPPMPEFAHLSGHGSYELAFRDAALYSWLLRHECVQRCASRPHAQWHALEGIEGDELRE